MNVAEWFENLFSNKNERKKSESRSSRSSTSKKKCAHPKKKSKYDHFPRYSEIERWMKNLAKCYPNRVKLEVIGCSVEKRPIYMIILGCPKLTKISVMLEAGIHAREWLSPTTAIYFVNHIVEHPDLMNDVDFYIIPSLNPDGYEFSHTCLRLWRKNMNKNGFRNVGNWGVDLNRNFPFSYGLPGSSPCPASVTYRGKNSLSEPESQSLANALNKYGKRIHLYVAIHAFGNLLLYPWGYTLEPTCDEKDLKNCGNIGASAMKSAYPNNPCYQVGKLSELMYLSSGGSSDYARGCHKIKFSYTLELPRGGKSGFEARPSQILRVAKEVFVGLHAMIEYVHCYYTSKTQKRKAEGVVFCEACKRYKTRET